MKMFQQLNSTKRWIMTAGAVVVLAVMLGIGVALACPVGGGCSGCCGGNGCTGCGNTSDSKANKAHSNCCNANFSGSALTACCNQGSTPADCMTGT